MTEAEIKERSYALRFETSDAVFTATPEIEQDMKAKPSGEEPVAWIRKLLKSDTPEEAITFTAYLLAPREAVWWGHECLAHVGGPETEPDMLRLVEDWVRDPNEDTRNAALAAGLEQENRTPGGWLVLAAGWSSGSLAGPENPPVPPPPFLTARSVNAAVLSSLAPVEWEERPKALADLIEIALTVVQEE